MLDSGQSVDFFYAEAQKRIYPSEYTVHTYLPGTYPDAGAGRFDKERKPKLYFVLMNIWFTLYKCTSLLFQGISMAPFSKVYTYLMFVYKIVFHLDSVIRLVIGWYSFIHKTVQNIMQDWQKKNSFPDFYFLCTPDFFVTPIFR